MALTPTEITVFLPFTTDAPPVETARRLVESVSVARALVGEDLLTGAITVRLPWAQSIYDDIVAYLSASGIPYELTVA